MLRQERVSAGRSGLREAHRMARDDGTRRRVHERRLLGRREVPEVRAAVEEAGDEGEKGGG